MIKFSLKIISIIHLHKHQFINGHCPHDLDSSGYAMA